MIILSLASSSFPLLVIRVIKRIRDHRLQHIIIMMPALIILCRCGLFVVLVTHRANRQWDQGVHRDPSLYRPIWSQCTSATFWSPPFLLLRNTLQQMRPIYVGSF